VPSALKSQRDTLVFSYPIKKIEQALRCWVRCNRLAVGQGKAILGLGPQQRA
jgi:hypothetical protein